MNLSRDWAWVRSYSSSDIALASARCAASSGCMRVGRGSGVGVAFAQLASRSAAISHPNGINFLAISLHVQLFHPLGLFRLGTVGFDIALAAVNDRLATRFGERINDINI